VTYTLGSIVLIGLALIPFAALFSLSWSNMAQAIEDYHRYECEHLCDKKPSERVKKP
jgi:hypothetical protein